MGPYSPTQTDSFDHLISGSLSSQMTPSTSPPHQITHTLPDPLKRNTYHIGIGTN